MGLWYEKSCWRFWRLRCAPCTNVTDRETNGTVYHRYQRAKSLATRHSCIAIGYINKILLGTLIHQVFRVDYVVMHETRDASAVLKCYRALRHHQPSSWKHRFNLYRDRELRIFGRFYVKKTWRVGMRIAYSASRSFFGGFSADENSAANTANGAGLGAYAEPGRRTVCGAFWAKISASGEQ